MTVRGEMLALTNHLVLVQTNQNCQARQENIDKFFASTSILCYNDHVCPSIKNKYSMIVLSHLKI
jgi:hypothetical protein